MNTMMLTRCCVLLLLCLSVHPACSGAAGVEPALPAGFERTGSGALVAVVRLDTESPQPNFAKPREVIEAQCKLLADLGQPAGPPTFQDGADKPGSTHMARFLRLDGSAELRLMTVQGYGLLKSGVPACQATYGPSSSRFLRLRKLISGRIHTWDVKFDTRKASHTIGPRQAHPSLLLSIDGAAANGQAGPVLGEDEVSGLKCEIRAVGNKRVCRFVRSGAVPPALQDLVAWIAPVGGGSDDFRFSFVGASSQIHESFFEPPSGFDYVVHDIRPAPGSSPDPRADTSDKPR